MQRERPPERLDNHTTEGRTNMITRRCTHCEAEVELPDSRASRCPVCGLDPDLPQVTFEDAPPFYFAFEIPEEAAVEPAAVRVSA